MDNKDKKPKKTKKDTKPIPKDMKLYEEVKKEAAKVYEKPSAYKSGWIVREYISRGGEYINDKKSKGELGSWIKSKWVDVGEAFKKGLTVKEMSKPGFDPVKAKVACGKTKNKDQYCRPAKAVGSLKRKTMKEIGEGELKKLVKDKATNKKAPPA